MKSRADDSDVVNLLIMVDDEGDLGDPLEENRSQAVQNHIKWLKAARILNCHSIRVNAFGSGDRDSLRAQLVDGLGNLSEYGAEIGINILIENHGLNSSDANYIKGIINEVGSKFLGSLPDFGNWCLNAKWGSTQGGKCSEIYDPYKGVEELLPFAKGVSAKSYDFDEVGNETTIDYRKMLQLVKSSEFDGYIGIEYEGSRLSEDMGIKTTKSLIERTWKELR
ncbi:MAG: TIM barrel protein, partial [Flavobacteriaceae bacterium]